jgi:acetolactate synthase regulatory subunit
MADNSHQIAVSARFRPEHAEAVLGVVESDPLNEARENFLR